MVHLADHLPWNRMYKYAPGSTALNSSLGARMNRLRRDDRCVQFSDTKSFYSKVEELKEDNKITEEQYNRLIEMKGYMNNIFMSNEGDKNIVMNENNNYIKEILITKFCYSTRTNSKETRCNKRIIWNDCRNVKDFHEDKRSEYKYR